MHTTSSTEMKAIPYGCTYTGKGVIQAYRSIKTATTNKNDNREAEQRRENRILKHDHDNPNETQWTSLVSTFILFFGFFSFFPAVVSGGYPRLFLCASSMACLSLSLSRHQETIFIFILFYFSLWGVVCSVLSKPTSCRAVSRQQPQHHEEAKHPAQKESGIFTV
eukprot:gene10034-7009_t